MTHRYGLGYSVGGDQAIPWQEFQYNDVSSENSGATDPLLKKFADPRPGRLSLEPREVHDEVPDPASCAAYCETIKLVWDHVLKVKVIALTP